MSEGTGSHTILVVERDLHCVDSLVSRLRDDGHEVATIDASVNSASTTRAALERVRPSLVMIDWDIPGMIVMDLIRHLRRHNDHSMRIVALSVYAGEDHIVTGLELGVDDYVVKPFSVVEVLARVHALLRSASRPTEELSERIGYRHLAMDTGTNRATYNERPVALRASEFRLLEFLLRHPERAFSRESLLSRVWGRTCTADVRTVDVTVQRLRKALSMDGCEGYVQTVRGVGYRLGP